MNTCRVKISKKQRREANMKDNRDRSKAITWVEDSFYELKNETFQDILGIIGVEHAGSVIAQEIEDELILITRVMLETFRLGVNKILTDKQLPALEWLPARRNRMEQRITDVNDPWHFKSLEDEMREDPRWEQV